MLSPIPILVLKLCLPRPDVIHVSFIQCKKLIDMWCCCCFFLIDSASLVCLHVFGIYVVLVCSGFVSFVCLIICERSLLHRLFIFHFCFLPKLVSPIVLKTNTSYLLFLFLLIKRKERRKKEYKDFLKNDFFPIITNRYKEKYKGSFPSTGNALVNNSLWLLCRKSLEDSYEKMGELMKII